MSHVLMWHPLTHLTKRWGACKLTRIMVMVLILAMTRSLVLVYSFSDIVLLLSLVYKNQTLNLIPINIFNKRKMKICYNCYNHISSCIYTYILFLLYICKQLHLIMPLTISLKFSTFYKKIIGSPLGLDYWIGFFFFWKFKLEGLMFPRDGTHTGLNSWPSEKRSLPLGFFSIILFFVRNESVQPNWKSLFWMQKI